MLASEPQDLKAIDLGHPDVRDHDVEGAAPKLVEGGPPADGDNHFPAGTVPAERPLKGRKDLGVVVDEQDPDHAASSAKVAG